MEISGILGVPAGLLFVAIPIVAGTVVTARMVRRRRTWTHVTGTVSSVKTKRAGDDTTTTVRYRFYDATGVQRTGTETTLRTPRKGKRVGVMYNPDNPDENELSSAVFLVFVLPLLAVMCAFGVYLFLSGLADLSGQAQ